MCLYLKFLLYEYQFFSLITWFHYWHITYLICFLFSFPFFSWPNHSHSICCILLCIMGTFLPKFLREKWGFALYTGIIMDAIIPCVTHSKPWVHIIHGSALCMQSTAVLWLRRTIFLFFRKVVSVLVEVAFLEWNKQKILN